MEIQEFIKKFAEAIDVDDTNITAETIFRDLEEWDSLAGLSIISLFEEEFGKELPIPTFRKAVTINDLFSLAQ